MSESIRTHPKHNDAPSSYRRQPGHCRAAVTRVESKDVLELVNHEQIRVTLAEPGQISYGRGFHCPPAQQTLDRLVTNEACGQKRALSGTRCAKNHDDSRTSITPLLVDYLGQPSGLPPSTEVVIPICGCEGPQSEVRRWPGPQ